MIYPKKYILAGLYFSFLLIFLNPLSRSYALETPEPLKTLSILKNKEYKSLDATLEAYQKVFEEDYLKEGELVSTYVAFYTSDPSIEAYLNEWIEKIPDSYSARLARGIYYTRMGWLKRGAKFIDKTSEKQIEGMKQFFSKAVIDLEAALKINPKTIAAYCYLINIEMALGNSDSKKVLLDNALQINPYSFAVRRYYIYSLYPKWGGSFEEMYKFVDESDKYLSENPKLKILRGYIDASKADAINLGFDNPDDFITGEKKTILEYLTSMLPRVYNFFYTFVSYIYNYLNPKPDPIEYYTRALSYGDYSYFFRERGEIYYKRGDYGKAMSDLNKTLELSPYDAEALRYRAKIFMRLKESGPALTDLNLAVQLDPLHSYTLTRRAALYNELKQYKDALKDYENALLNAENDARVWRDKGILVARIFKDYEGAKHDLEKAIELNPDDSKAWYFHGFALYYLRDYNAENSFEEYLKLSKNNPKRDKGKVYWAEKFLACVKIPSQRNSCYSGEVKGLIKTDRQ